MNICPPTSGLLLERQRKDVSIMKKIQLATANSNNSQLPAHILTTRGYNKKSSKGFGSNSPFLDGSIVCNAWLNSQSEAEKQLIFEAVAINYRSYFDRGNNKRVNDSFRNLLPAVIGENDVQAFWSAMPDEFASELSRDEEWLSGFVSSITDYIWSDDRLTKLAAKKIQ